MQEATTDHCSWLAPPFRATTGHMQMLAHVLLLTATQARLRPSGSKGTGSVTNPCLAGIGVVSHQREHVYGISIGRALEPVAAHHLRPHSSLLHLNYVARYCRIYWEGGRAGKKTLKAHHACGWQEVWLVQPAPKSGVPTSQQQTCHILAFFIITNTEQACYMHSE